MKTGRTLVELATEIERQYESKEDYVLPVRQLTAYPVDRPDGEMEKGVVRIDVPGHGSYQPTDVAYQQLATQTQIPMPYLSRTLDSDPALAALNLNHWLRQSSDRRMVRTMSDLDGTPRFRAMLSDRYRRLDHYDLMGAILPSLMELRSAGDIEIVSSEITERKLYIKLTTPRIKGDVKVGDTVQAGAVISNSEVGLGAISVKLLLYRLSCMNGAITDYGTRARHVGRVIGDSSDDLIMKLYSDETLQADDHAFFLRVRDVVRGTLLDGTIFNAALDKMRQAAEARIEGDPVEAVEVLGKKYNLAAPERQGVLRHLIEGADLSLWGVVNAVTRESQNVGSYDRATDLETLGGTLIDLPRSEWREIATAVPRRRVESQERELVLA